MAKFWLWLQQWLSIWLWILFGGFTVYLAIVGMIGATNAFYDVWGTTLRIVEWVCTHNHIPQIVKDWAWWWLEPYQGKGHPMTVTLVEWLKTWIVWLALASLIWLAIQLVTAILAGITGGGFHFLWFGRSTNGGAVAVAGGTTATFTGDLNTSLKLLIHHLRGVLFAFAGLLVLLFALNVLPWSARQVFETIGVIKSQSTFNAQVKKYRCDTKSGIIAFGDVGQCIGLANSSTAPDSVKSQVKTALDATCTAYYFYLPGTPAPKWVPKGSKVTAEQYNKAARQMRDQGACKLKLPTSWTPSSLVPHPSSWWVIPLVVWVVALLVVMVRRPPEDWTTHTVLPTWSGGWWIALVIRALVFALVIGLLFWGVSTLLALVF